MKMRSVIEGRRNLRGPSWICVSEEAEVEILIGCEVKLDKLYRGRDLSANLLSEFVDLAYFPDFPA